MIDNNPSGRGARKAARSIASIGNRTEFDLLEIIKRHIGRVDVAVVKEIEAIAADELETRRQDMLERKRS